MSHICEGRVARRGISDPLLDDLTLLMSAALMDFSVAHPKVSVMEAVRGETFDGDTGHASLPAGSNA
jgi:hypothetical protein